MFASGGATVPLILLASSAVFSANTLATDLDKVISGNDEGRNVLKGIFQGGLGDSAGAFVYEGANFVSGVAGSGDAFKELAEKGIVVGISQDSRSVVSSINKDFGKNIVSGIINSSKSVLPKTVEGVSVATVGKEVGKGLGSVKDKVINATIDTTKTHVENSLKNTVDGAKINQVQSIIDVINQQNKERQFVSNLGSL